MELSIGQCCVDMMNVEDSVLGEIDRRVREFIPLAQTLLEEKTDSAAALAQEKLNAVWDVIFFCRSTGVRGWMKSVTTIRGNVAPSETERTCRKVGTHRSYLGGA